MLFCSSKILIIIDIHKIFVNAMPLEWKYTTVVLFYSKDTADFLSTSWFYP